MKIKTLFNLLSTSLIITCVAFLTFSTTAAHADNNQGLPPGTLGGGSRASN